MFVTVDDIMMRRAQQQEIVVAVALPGRLLRVMSRPLQTGDVADPADNLSGRDVDEGSLATRERTTIAADRKQTLDRCERDRRHYRLFYVPSVESVKLGSHLENQLPDTLSLTS